MFFHVTTGEYVEDYKRVTFNNGVLTIVDLKAELYGEIFEPLKDLALFRQLYLTSRTIEWSNGTDFAPEYLLELARSCGGQLDGRTPASG